MLPTYAKPVFDLPCGPKNLAGLFPSIDFSKVEEYYVTLKAGDGEVLVTTPVMVLCNCPDVLRLHFQTYLGRFDAVNFDQVRIVHKAESGEFRRPLPDAVQRTDTGIERLNIRANDVYEGITYKYDERAMDWLAELLDSPFALMEMDMVEGQESFLPMRILDGQFEKRTVDEKSVMEFRVQFKLANEFITIRN